MVSNRHILYLHFSDTKYEHKYKQTLFIKTIIMASTFFKHCLYLTNQPYITPYQTLFLSFGQSSGGGLYQSRGEAATCHRVALAKVPQKNRIESVIHSIGEEYCCCCENKKGRPNVGQSDKPIKQRSFRRKAVRELKTKIKQLPKDLKNFFSISRHDCQFRPNDLKSDHIYTEMHRLQRIRLNLDVKQKKKPISLFISFSNRK